MNRNRVLMIMVAGLLAAMTGWTQQAPPATRSEEPKTSSEEPSEGVRSEELMRQRLEYFQNKPRQSWDQFVAEWLTPKPFAKKQVVQIDEKYAFSHVASSIKMEIVREDEDSIWLRGIPPEDPESPLYPVWAQRQADEARFVQAAEAMSTPGAVYFLDFAAEPVPPGFQTSLDFVKPDGKLPDAGRWQMNFAVADMNEDGIADLVFPPRRQTYPPEFAVLIGSGDGTFKLWDGVKWPTSIRIDYGGVAVADMDGDGHQDIVAAIHFGPQYILYGNGKGDFSRAERLPMHDPRLSARAVTAGDFDGDGRTDLAFVAEIDYDMKANEKIENASSIWVVYRRGESWKVVAEGFPATHIGDVIDAADVNGDGRTDLVVSSNSSGERRLVYLNKRDETWGPARFNGVLSSAYHYDVEFKNGEIFAAFVQFRMYDGQTTARNGIVAYPFAFREEGWRSGEPVVFDKERTNVYFRIALGDLNGDGRTDLVAGRKNGGLEVFLRQADGQFVRETTDAFEATGTVYGLRLLDLDGDGRDDIVTSFVPAGRNPGGVGIWLSRSKGGSS